MSTLSVRELLQENKSVMLVYQHELEDFIKDGWHIVDTLRGEQTSILLYLVAYKKGQKTAPFSTQAMEFQNAN